MPHAWKTGIAIEAACHLAAVVPECDYIELLPRALSSSKLRQEPTMMEPVLLDGA